MGIIPTNEALERAESYGLDLVEVSANSRPPVCRILDYGKFKYELSKKDKLAKKKQHSIQLKEMRYRPKIDEHDFQFKTRHVREFLESGSKVRVFVMFRGREMARKEFGRKVLDRVVDELKDIANIESQPKQEGRTMAMVIGPNAEIMKQIKNARQEKQEKPAKQEEPEQQEKPVRQEKPEQQEKPEELEQKND